MKVIEEKTTVVIAGAFNPAILRPQWVAVHGLGYPENHEFQVEMLAPVGGAGSTRYNFDGFSYSAGFKSVTLHLKSTDFAQCHKSLLGVANVLTQLPHTPVAGLGFNFGFVVEDPPAELLALLATHDEMTDSFAGDSEVVTRRWGNTVKWEGVLVNIDCELAGGQATIAFNFHHSTTSANEAEKILKTDGVFEKYFERAAMAAKALTGQDLED